jgi:hypothetical protein
MSLTIRPGVHRRWDLAVAAVAAVLVLEPWALVRVSAQASTSLFVSEVHPAAAGTGATTWTGFEITNAGFTAVNISGWKVDDSSNAFASAVPLSGVTSIAPGQSVIFIDGSVPVDLNLFAAAWFAGSVPSSLTIGTYGGSGIGLSTGGDAINLFDAGGNRITGISFGSATPNKTFDNAAGIGSTALPLPVVTTVSEAGVNAGFVSANGTETGSPGRRRQASPLSSVDLSTYLRVGRFDLPEPTRTTPPADSVLAQEVSGVTYNWDTDTLFVVGDGGTSVVQVTKTGQLIDSMTLVPGTSPQGTEFYDPEGLAYVGGGRFVMVEERDRQFVEFAYVPGGRLTRADTRTVKLGTFVDNTGVEGLTYDPSSGRFIAVKETQPQGLFETGVDFAAGTATNGSPTVGWRYGPVAESIGDSGRRRQRPAGAEKQHRPWHDDQPDDRPVHGSAGISVRAGRHAENQRCEEQDRDPRAGGVLGCAGRRRRHADPERGLVSGGVDRSRPVCDFGLPRGDRDPRKGALDTRAKAKLILDPTVAGLTASQVAIYVAGRDDDCRRNGADDDGDDAGPVAVHIGAQNVVQANIVASRGTVWLKSRTRATGAFIGVHVWIGVNAQLILDSAFR